jgi:hypothetical protein
MMWKMELVVNRAAGRASAGFTACFAWKMELHIGVGSSIATVKVSKVPLPQLAKMEPHY